MYQTKSSPDRKEAQKLFRESVKGFRKLHLYVSPSFRPLIQISPLVFFAHEFTQMMPILGNQASLC